MTEWYVLLVGGKPTEVIPGRRAAHDKLTDNFRVTPAEARQLTAFLTAQPGYGSGVLLVGYDRRPDRALVRCIGPEV